MEQELYIKLIQQELSGTITDTDQQLLLDWMSANEDNQQLAEDIKRAWSASTTFGHDIEVDLVNDYINVQQKIGTSSKGKVYKIPYYIGAIAASVLILIAGFVWLQPSASNTILAPHDHYAVQLPDGTEVYLSKGSKLTYGVDFSKQRSVKMTGNAFFKVAHNATSPFMVKSPHATTTVLGTEFFVDDLKNGSNAIIKLIKGRVSVNSLIANDKTLLSPGQQAVIQKDGSINKKRLLSLQDQHWYFDNFSFEDVLLADAILLVEGFFGTSISVDRKISDCPISGKIPFDSSDKVVSIIAQIFGASVTESGNTYKIIGGSCMISE